MKERRLIFSPYLVLAALVILSVSICPAMASGASNRGMSSSAIQASSSNSLSVKPSPSATPAVLHATKEDVESKKWYQKGWVWTTIYIAVVLVLTILIVASAGTAAPAAVDVGAEIFIEEIFNGGALAIA